MGMFDSIRCEVLLPDGFDPQGKEFQTKDFDCDLLTHAIKEDGIYFSKAEPVWIPLEEIKNPFEWEKEQGGRQGKKEQLAKDTTFTGVVNFYTDIPSSTLGKRGGWREYNAHYENGTLQRIEYLYGYDEV